MHEEMYHRHGRGLSSYPLKLVSDGSAQEEHTWISSGPKTDLLLEALGSVPQIPVLTGVSGPGTAHSAVSLVEYLGPRLAVFMIQL